jgi:exopolysaccharide biosynthesis polyprenyl glycosylphosphotransferase
MLCVQRVNRDPRTLTPRTVASEDGVGQDGHRSGNGAAEEHEMGAGPVGRAAVDIGGAQPARLAAEQSEGTTVLAPVPRPPARRGWPSAATVRGKSIQIVADAIAVFLAQWIVWHFARGGRHVPLDPVLWTAAPLTFLLVFGRMRLYSARSVALALEELRSIVYGCLLSSLIVGYLVAHNSNFPALKSRYVLLLAILSMVFVTIERRMTRHYFSRRRAHGRGTRPTVLVGAGPDCSALESVIRANPDLGYRIVARCAPIGSRNATEASKEIVEAVQRTDASTLLVAQNALDGESTKALARVLHDCGVRVELSSGLAGIDATRLTVASIAGRPIFYLEPTVQRGWRALAKRSFDIVVSTIVLVITSPIVALAALVIKLNDRGPVFFRQERVGKGGTPFLMVKMRTMVPDAEARLPELEALNEGSGPMFKMKRDPRVTRVGRILRKLSIDELPQCWNVLKGDMSMVGPRPALPREVGQWRPEVRERLRVKPGITGMWQVSGRSDSSFDDYVRLDLYYVDNWNLVYDLAIIAKTIPAILHTSGAY